MKYILVMTSLILGLISCKSNYIDRDSFLITKKDEIEKYFVYSAKQNYKDENSFVLLSIKEPECNALNEIKVGNIYKFDLEKISSILTEDGVSISLVRGQSINGIKLSDGNNFPFLIKNSCNGKLVDKY